MRTTPFEGEVELYDSSGQTIETAAGFFELEWVPDMPEYGGLRVIRRDDLAVVAYLTHDDDSTPFWKHFDGYGMRYRKREERYDFLSALGLNQYESLECYDFEDQVEQAAIGRAAQRVLDKLRPSSTVTRIQPGAQLVLFKQDGKRYRWKYACDLRMLNGRYTDVLLIGNNVEPIEEWDSDAIIIPLWQRARELGELGEKWAVLTQDRSPSLSHDHWKVNGPWSAVDPNELYKASGVWVPSDDLISDIESAPDPWAKAVELAEQFIAIYNEWANGNCYDVNIEIFRHIAGSGNAFDTTEDAWERVMDTDATHDHDLGGGIYYGMDEAEEVMQEDITQALELLDTLREESHAEEIG